MGCEFIYGCESHHLLSRVYTPLRGHFRLRQLPIFDDGSTGALGAMFPQFSPRSTFYSAQIREEKVGGGGRDL